MRFTAALLLLATSTVSAYDVLSLTPDNFAEKTDGKTVFIKFFAPWCGHCKSMAPAWEKLAEAYDGNAVGLIAEVDCTAEGDALCEDQGVQGFPTVKWGDPSALEDYQGGRDFEDLKAFADANLKPMCSPRNIDLCDDAKKAEIKKFQDMSESDLDEFIGDQEEKAAKIEEDFESFVEGLQNQYEKAMEKKDKDVAELKKAGLGLAKAVKAIKAQGGSDEL